MLALLLVLPGKQLNVNVNEFPLEGKLTGLFISPHSGGPATTRGEAPLDESLMREVIPLELLEN